MTVTRSGRCAARGTVLCCGPVPMLASLVTQTFAEPDRPAAEPERLGVTRRARDTAGLIARLRRLRRRRAVGELDEETYRREAERLSSDPGPATDPDAAS